jgi:outer membrane protein W
MKKLTLTLCAVAAMASAAFAGTSTYSSKEVKQVEQAPCPTWYADNEWNVGVSLAYAFNTNDDDDNNIFFDRGSWDDAWGGALDVKYFFRKNFGIGFQAFGLSIGNDDQDFRNFVGDQFEDFDGDDDNVWNWGALGTFTMRFPMACSRFAPYVWVGIGGYFTDDSDDRFAFLDDDLREAFDRNDDDGGKWMGQFGAGFEIRFSQHFGWTNDISFNDVEGGDHDFVMLRTGLNFAF